MAVAAPKAPEAPSAPAVEPLRETPEFRRAVADSIKELLPDLRKEIMESLGGLPKPQGGDTGFAEALAMQLAALTSQGVGKKIPVAPEVLKIRAEAEEKMLGLLVAAREAQTPPTYILRAKIYVGDRLIEPKWVDPQTKSQRDTEIDWYGVPNEAMLPVNDVAKEVMFAYEMAHTMKPKEALSAPNLRNGGFIFDGKVVVRAGEPAQRVTNAPGAMSEVDGLRVKGRDLPGQYVQKNIVGTIAAPAIQLA